MQCMSEFSAFCLEDSTHKNPYLPNNNVNLQWEMFPLDWRILRCYRAMVAANTLISVCYNEPWSLFANNAVE